MCSRAPVSGPVKPGWFHRLNGEGRSAWDKWRRRSRAGASSWHRVDPVDVPAEGRVRSVTVDGRTVALARWGAGLGALENRCPHQGGPLGEGSIENGWLRCPWYGYDYDPLTGRSPEGFSDGALLLLGPSPAVQVGGLLPHLRGQVLGFEPARARLSP
jgi:nitrite reductase/ring-hydroxylating ferredoxin subunit